MPARNAERLQLLVFVLLLPILALANVAHADAPANVPEQYRNFFRHYVDNRSFTEKALNVIGFSKEDLGRSFALLASVSRYPKMKGTAANLRPAQVDVEKLAAYLVQREFFDEVVVLLDDAVSDTNLSFFLERYFPQRLSEAPRSRFLFAYSGHGTTRLDGRGYLLRPRFITLACGGGWVSSEGRERFGSV